MEKMDYTYSVTLSDFRKAFYFAMFQRHRKLFRLASVILGLGLLYGLVMLSTQGEPNRIVLFVALAYLIYVLVILGGAELDIRKYVKNPENYLGKTYHFQINGNKVAFSLPEKNIHTETATSKLACVFETSSAFLVYQDGANLYILPHRALGEDREELRLYFQKELGDRFFSRFLPKE